MSRSLSQADVLSERLRRHCLSAPLATPEGYDDLFARLQPVAPVADGRPGDPPRLVHRTRFDDGVAADERRARRLIVKGRFQAGAIGYVRSVDLPLYARAFARPLARLDPTHRAVFEAVRRLGPLTPRQIKEETGLLNKRIMPALHRLQEAFLVYEDQVDSDWERGWYELAAEWPTVAEVALSWEEAAGRVMRRFMWAHVFATAEQVRDWAGWPARALAGLLTSLERDGSLVPRVAPGLGEGWMLAEDEAPTAAPPTLVVMLHRADPLARAHASELKRRFGHHEVLQYLLIDGRFDGAVLGHWRIGPHDVDDIVIERPAAERAARQGEILAAVAYGYQPPRSRILRYDGRALAEPPSANQ